MINKLRLLLASIPLLVALVAFPVAAGAFNTYEQLDCSGNNRAKSAVCTERGNTGDPVAGNNGLFAGIVNVLSYIAGAAAIIVLIVGGIKYATSGGDSNNVASAKRTVIAALVGLLFIALARTLVAVVVQNI